MFSWKRRALSQNFFYSRKLINQLVGKSSIEATDAVLEIGPGKGIITEALLNKARLIIAVELDSQLCAYLKRKFENKNLKLKIVHQNFLNFPLPKYPYKVFANIPFSIEGKIIRKLLSAENQPKDCCLVVRKDLAKRLGGFKNECLFSLLFKPWFCFEIIHYFCKTDFKPAARMETVLLRIKKRETSLLRKETKNDYEKFICPVFSGGKKLKQNLKKFFSYKQIKMLSKDNKFDLRAKPTDLTFKQWLKIFEFKYKTINK